jgi:hypothetical protein
LLLESFSHISKFLDCYLEINEPQIINGLNICILNKIHKQIQHKIQTSY